MGLLIIKEWNVDIVTDMISVSYKVEVEDSYDAKLRALEIFYHDYSTPARLSDIDSCHEV